MMNSTSCMLKVQAMQHSLQRLKVFMESMSGPKEESCLEEDWHQTQHITLFLRPGTQALLITFALVTDAQQCTYKQAITNRIV